MAVGLVATAIGMRTFFYERPVYWREVSSGSSGLAYFVAKNLVDVILFVLHVLGFISAFIFVSSPQASFSDYFLLLLVYELVLCSASYLFSWSIPQPALLSGVVALLSGLGTGASQPLDDMGPVQYITPSRFFGESFYISEVRLDYMTQEQRDREIDFAESYFNYDMDNWSLSFYVLLSFVFTVRILSFVAMKCINRSKQL
jgi:hypothetical protein